MEEYTNIEFSDKLAIFDIWPRNFEYTGRFPYIRSYGAILWRIFDIRAQNDHVNSKLDM